MAITALPQPMLQPKVPSMWAQPGSYQPDANKPHFETELEINDFPQHARWKVWSSHPCMFAPAPAARRVGANVVQGLPLWQSLPGCQAQDILSRSERSVAMRTAAMDLTHVHQEHWCFRPCST